MYREYRAEGRYGYIGIDEYHHEHAVTADGPCSCARTVLTGIRPLKLGRAVAEALQAAYDAGRADMFREAQSTIRIFAEDRAANPGKYPG